MMLKDMFIPKTDTHRPGPRVNKAVEHWKMFLSSLSNLYQPCGDTLALFIHTNDEAGIITPFILLPLLPSIDERCLLLISKDDDSKREGVIVWFKHIFIQVTKYADLSSQYVLNRDITLSEKKY